MAVEHLIAKTIAQFKAEWEPRLIEAHAHFNETLPASAHETWTRGAAYIRVSCARSLVNDAPDTQLHHTLNLLAVQQVYVPAENVFFDVHTGADYGRRAALQEMIQIAENGGIKAIGVYLNERLFRNLEQAIKTKRDFRLKGVELYYLGSYQGDPRNPVAWQQQVISDFTAELHARTTSYYVGNHLEQLSRAGRPVGQIPEAYEPGERETTFMGRQGKVKSWKFVEPLATIIAEGCRRFLGGETLINLAKWAATTELGGLTPAGRVMDVQWWHQTLRNPRYAGYQAPTSYTGYRPGIESPARRRIDASTELVPSLLPALWSLDDYHAIHATLKSRYRGPRKRRTYRKYLLSGIAYDATCGHRMQVKQSTAPDRFLMRCEKRAVGGFHSHHLRADVAERELEELLAGLSFEDPELIAHIERELREMEQTDRRECDKFRANPEIGALRQAIASLSNTSQLDVTSDLERRVEDLIAADAARREELSVPLVNYRKALRELDQWETIWRSGEKDQKNKLLRDAGVRVVIGRPEGDDKGTPRIIEISADNAAFQLALAAAAEIGEADQWAFVGDKVLRPTNAYIRMRIAGDLAQAAGASIHEDERGAYVPLRRPTIDSTRPIPGGPWLTVAEVAKRLGLTEAGVQHRIKRGQIDAETVMVGNVKRRLVRADHFAALLAENQLVPPVTTSGQRWLSVPEFARAVGTTPAGVAWRIRQGHLPAVRLIRGATMGSWRISQEHVAVELGRPTKRIGRPKLGRAA
ncbi:MAG TPA: recombinase family protein [Thermomicrobiales bacterium]|nr:recombinase family protein [Thermomicrobiales bacterium]